MPRLRCLSLHSSRVHAVLLAVLLSLLAPSAARAQAGPATAMPLMEYRAALQTARTALTAEPPDMAAARQALAAAETIVLRSGATVTVTPLLGGDDASLTPAEALARVETALQQLDASTGDRTAERLRLLDDVLAGPAFQQSESLLDRLRRWLAELLARSLPDSDMPGTDQPGRVDGGGSRRLGCRGRRGDRAAPAPDPVAAHPDASLCGRCDAGRRGRSRRSRHRGRSARRGQPLGAGWRLSHRRAPTLSGRAAHPAGATHRARATAA